MTLCYFIVIHLIYKEDEFLQDLEFPCSDSLSIRVLKHLYL